MNGKYAVIIAVIIAGLGIIAAFEFALFPTLNSGSYNPVLAPRADAQNIGGSKIIDCFYECPVYPSNQSEVEDKSLIGGTTKNRTFGNGGIMQAKEDEITAELTDR